MYETQSILAKNQELTYLLKAESDHRRSLENYGYHITGYKSDELLTEQDINDMQVLKGNRIFIGEAVEKMGKID